MAYIDDIVIATETLEEHMVRLCEVFECLPEAGFKVRVAKLDFMKSEIKYLGRVVSAEGVKPGPKAVAKLCDWDIPSTKLKYKALWASLFIIENSFNGTVNWWHSCMPSLE